MVIPHHDARPSRKDILDAAWDAGREVSKVPVSHLSRPFCDCLAESLVVAFVSCGVGHVVSEQRVHVDLIASVDEEIDSFTVDDGFECLPALLRVSDDWWVVWECVVA